MINKINIKDLTGQVFGKLTVLDFAGLNKDKKSLWRCQCSCEKKSIIYKSEKNLKYGEVKSCGCIVFPTEHERAERKKNDLISKMNVVNSCWEWKGPVLNKRYGYTTYNFGKGKKKITCHRLSYILFKGKIHEKMCVLHSCDNPICFNPDHLHLGTQQDNINEMKQRGRERKVKGIRNHISKTNPEEVRKMRKLYQCGASTSELSKIFGLKRNTIWYIVTNKTWKNE